MSRWSEASVRSLGPVFVLTLPWLVACGEGRPNEANDGERGGAPSGGSGGRQMIVAGSGQGAASGNASGGRGGATSTAGRGGSPGGGEGGSGGTAGRGQAGRVSGGGAGGEHGGMAGEGGADVNGGSGGGSTGSCRVYAAEYTLTSSSTFVTVSCAFARASLSMTCTTDDGGVTVTTWATLEDAIAENRPLGLRRAVRSDEKLALGTAGCHLTRDFRYDGSGRLTAMEVTIDPEMPCGTNQATYDAWDSDGRQTHGVESGVGGETCAGGDVAFTYDDAARTITTARSGGTDCVAFTTVLNHDADGLRTTAVNGTSGAVTSTYETVATGEICE